MSGTTSPAMRSESLKEILAENEKLCIKINELREKIRKLEEENKDLSKLCGVHATNG